MLQDRPFAGTDPDLSFFRAQGTGFNEPHTVIVEKQMIRWICIEVRGSDDLPHPKSHQPTPEEMGIVWIMHGGIVSHGVRRCVDRLSVGTLLEGLPDLVRKRGTVISQIRHPPGHLVGKVGQPLRMSAAPIGGQGRDLRADVRGFFRVFLVGRGGAPDFVRQRDLLEDREHLRGKRFLRLSASWPVSAGSA